jgi:hypothetical protein
MANVPVSPELLEISVIVVNLDIMAFHQVDADDATATTKVVLPLIVMRLDNVNVKIMLMVNSVINVQLISSTWIPTILKVVKLASVMVMEYHVQRFKVLDFKE